MRRALVLLATVASLLAAISASAGAVVPKDLALRLRDLGPGYMVDDRPCSPMNFRDAGPSRFLRRIGALHHVGCSIDFSRMWKAPGTPPSPLDVTSYVFVFDSTDGPEAALKRPRAIVRFLSEEAAHVVEPAPTIGDEAVLLQGGVQRAGRRSLWHTTVLWRSGNVLAAVRTVSQRSADVSTQAALRLAAVQQTRIASPTPLGPDDNDDAEVGLDNPKIHLPIYWLGRDLAARGGRPELSLHFSLSFRLRGIEAVFMTYGRDDKIAIMVTRPSLLRLPIFSRELRRLAHDPCTHREGVALQSGHATIWFRQGHNCRVRAEDTFAIMRLPGVIVVVGLGAERRRSAGYATPAGMRRLLRALRPRAPKPLPAPARPTP
ncbi:MAG: hypothetical protein JSS99_17485 [Actinobacteria bacterium]|nr:hypothetical protein [Actinomycetota bacterium]